MKYSLATWLTGLSCALLAACGGGGGGGGSTPTPPVAATSLAMISTPANFDFSNFGTKTVTWQQVTSDALASAASSARVTDNKIHVQIWYLDAASVRQPLAITTLAAFKSAYPSGLVIKDIPKSLSKLQAESYFWDTAQAKAITTGILEIAL